ncbi:MAG: RagB/SusD family nutrient uptake outer membrane protein [Parabacteroides johnsonii]
MGSDNTNQTRTANIWTKLYTAIRNCNVALEHLPQASQMSEDKINSYIGELRFIRGLSYFYLVRYFGDIPLHMKKI